jgi:carbonic anhydrase
VHGWIYGLKDGLVHDLHMEAGSEEEQADNYRTALDALL